MGLHLHPGRQPCFNVINMLLGRPSGGTLEERLMNLQRSSMYNPSSASVMRSVKDEIG